MTKSMVRRARLCESVCVMYRSIRGILPDTRPNLQSESPSVIPTFERPMTNLYCLILNCVCVFCIVWCCSTENHEKINATSGNRSKLNCLPCTSENKALVLSYLLCKSTVCAYFWNVARADIPSFATMCIMEILDL